MKCAGQSAPAAVRCNIGVCSEATRDHAERRSPTHSDFAPGCAAHRAAVPDDHPSAGRAEKEGAEGQSRSLRPRSFVTRRRLKFQLVQFEDRHGVIANKESSQSNSEFGTVFLSHKIGFVTQPKVCRRAVL